MTITFGSVGDIISICLIVKDLAVALDESRGSTNEYREVIRELWGLDKALLEIDLLSRTCDNAPELTALWALAQRIVEDCRSCVGGFKSNIQKYDAALGDGGSQGTCRKAAMRLRWAIKRADIDRFRAEVNAHKSSLDMLLSVANVRLSHFHSRNVDARLTEQSQSQDTLLTEVRDRLKQTNKLIALGSIHVTRIIDALKMDWFRQLGSDLMSYMYRIFTVNVATYKAVVALQTSLSGSLERCLIQEPFLLEDAIGRLFPVHMQFIGSWEAFEAVLEHRFRSMRGHRKIRNREYALQEHATQRDIQRYLPWEASFLPGQKIDMSMIIERRASEPSETVPNCPNCKEPSAELQSCDIQCAKCGMWYRRITKYDDVELTLAPLNLTNLPRVDDTHDLQSTSTKSPCVSCAIHEPVAKRPEYIKSKLDSSDLEGEDLTFFKRVRVISWYKRVKSNSHTSIVTEQDIKQNILAEYFLKDLDAGEESHVVPCYTLGPESSGKGIHDWTAFHFGLNNPITEFAGQFRLLLNQVLRKIKHGKESIPHIKTQENRGRVENLVDSGDGLVDDFMFYLRRCESPILEAIRMDRFAISKSIGKECIEKFFGHDEQSKPTEKMMASMQLWNSRFDAECEAILRKPAQ